MKSEFDLYEKRKAAILSVMNNEQNPSVAFSGLWESFPKINEIQPQQTAVLPPHLAALAAENADARAAAAVIFHRCLRQSRLMTNPGVQPPKIPEPQKPMTIEDEWRSDPILRKEFGTIESFTSYLKAIESGRAKIIGGLR
jgi:hypothetical protein